MCVLTFYEKNCYDRCRFMGRKLKIYRQVLSSPPHSLKCCLFTSFLSQYGKEVNNEMRADRTARLFFVITVLSCYFTLALALAVADVLSCWA